MFSNLTVLDATIKELKNKVSEDPDPFLIDVLDRLLVIKKNQQETLVKKAHIEEKYRTNRGFKGFGVS
jgi:hypothetical protein